MATPTTATEQVVAQWSSAWWQDPGFTAAFDELRAYALQAKIDGKRADSYEVSDDNDPAVITTVANYLDLASAQEGIVFMESLVAKYSLPLVHPFSTRPIADTEPPHYIVPPTAV